MRHWILLTALIALPAVAADDIKEGQWEFTNTMKMPGMPDMAELAKQMPPGMKLPEGLNIGAGAGGGMSITMKQCVTNDSARPPIKDESKFNCETTKEERSGGTMQWAMHCTGKNTDFTSEGTATYSGNSMTSDVITQGTLEGHPAEMTMKTTGRYLGACPK